MDAGNLIRLTGKSLKGKNRIREHGDMFVVERVNPMPCFGGAAGARVTAVSGTHARNIRVHNDSDFFVEIVE